MEWLSENAVESETGEHERDDGWGDACEPNSESDRRQ
jgi:hypothetical protein